MSSEAINSFAGTSFQEICTGDTALYTCRVATSKILIVPCHIITQNSNLRYVMLTTLLLFPHATVL